MSDPSPWEYTQDTCDAWEIHHLCNHFAGYGWEVVAVVPAPPGINVSERIGDETGPLRPGSPLLPYTVLFKRPLAAHPTEEGTTDHG